VDKGAQLDDGVVVGPHCVVGPDVSIGDGTVLQAHVVLTGRIRIGRDNRFFPNVTIGCWPQILGINDETPLGDLVIGDRNTIRENATIHPSKHEGHATQIGSDNLLMIGTHIGHDCTVEDKVVLSNLVQLGGHAKIEQGAWLSGLAASHQFVTVGRWSYVAGLAGLNRDVPPFVVVSGHYPPRVRGVNKRGMVRAGLTEQQQEHIFEAYRRLYRQGGALITQAQKLAAEDGLDENVRDMLTAIFRSHEHRFGRYRESLRTD
jgi:UDP-N-acetylglucosamine acyltransferase